MNSAVYEELRKLRRSGSEYVFTQKRSSKRLRCVASALAIDKVQRVTGIDFFHSLEDEIEEEIESTLDLTKWDFD